MRTLITVCATGITAATLAGCEVETTREAALPDVDVSIKKGQLPAYEVKKTQDGKLPDVDVAMKGGQLPAFEVETADVEVDKTEVSVSVPDVEMKQKKITVPTIDIEMPDERNMAEEAREKAEDEESESSS